MGRNKSLSWILAFWKKVALSIISESAVQWKWALLHVFLAERTVRSTSGLCAWQKVRADSENPVTIESSRTQVLPGLILQFGCFQLNVKQLWPSICSSHWNPSEGKLSPISSSLPTPSMQLCFLRTERGRDGQLAEAPPKKVAFLISVQSNEILIQPFIFQCLYLGTRRTGSKIRSRYECCWRLSGKQIRDTPSGNKINKWSQREDKVSCVYGIVLHAEYNRVSFTERDRALKKVFSIVCWWDSRTGWGRSTLGHQADQQELGVFRNPVSKSSQIAPPATCTLYELPFASSLILELSKLSMSRLSLLACQGPTLLFPRTLRKGELGSDLCLSLDNRNVRL